tara:strand:- start:109 stop:894 length:786 start_codon:yes stop_codon:yes gene_type:complete
MKWKWLFKWQPPDMIRAVQANFAKKFTLDPKRVEGLKECFNLLIVTPLIIEYLLVFFGADRNLESNNFATNLFLLLSFLQLFFFLYLWAYLVNLFAGRDVYERAFERAFKGLISTIVALLICSLGFLLFIFPGLIFAKRYFFSPYIAMNDLVGPLEALKRSKDISNITGWKIFWKFIFKLLIFSALFTISYEAVMLCVLAFKGESINLLGTNITGQKYRIPLLFLGYLPLCFNIAMTWLYEVELSAYVLSKYFKVKGELKV